jgi:hypothetical protein
MPQSPAQRATVGRVMHEFKHGELKTAGGKGPKVTSRRQAVAIALEESGSTDRETPGRNARNARRTQAKERQGRTAEAEREGRRAQDHTLARAAARGATRRPAGRSKAELYAEAKRRDLPGRARMTKAELEAALHRRRH